MYLASSRHALVVAAQKVRHLFRAKRSEEMVALELGYSG
jgi:hypothetical protein